MSGKTILVVGGAAGIGKEFVRNRIKKGDKVAFTDLNEDAGLELLKEVNGEKDQAMFFPHNVTNWENTKAVVDKIMDKFGQIDVLVHSAGITNQTAWDDLTFEQWQKTIDINLTGLFYSLKAVTPYMLEKRAGNIVIIGSGSAITGSGGGLHYATSKGGAFGLMRAIAKKYSHQGLTINLVAPRVIETDMLKKLYPTEESKKALLEKIPVKKFGTLEDTTNAINFLISEKAKYVQGQVLLLDGGRTYLSS
ncbi:SDR family NAD(P)-dependent oxidoreductase [Pseudogracilibacillus auburnensis]|uniref:SDR family NAD(P)-dependent oxidoreductase n=1 Tax=Pseudogracilibacillus auburnensis TaxID=1494959 RepID=UPI001A964848|nr:SDR family oxidoreductase [Pseudogracilibacillus auburnensis]MBO1001998.1 SDR family oxidoreductase [Pseudogracilibacillus auburnensis]